MSGSPLPGLPTMETRDAFDGLAGARVLIVDDNRINRNLLLALLERGGITLIEQAEDGQDALVRMERFKPDLVLLDLMMPQMDGFEMCRRLRAYPRWKSLPVLVQSSLNRTEPRLDGGQSGISGEIRRRLRFGERAGEVFSRLPGQCGTWEGYTGKTAPTLSLPVESFGRLARRLQNQALSRRQRSQTG